ncbi:MAG: response regulator [Deltaproteobacteria bacterium]|nr:response regulator [Deltaproteobacteria bacterium]
MASVMVIDDDADVVEAISMVLTLEGFGVLVAESEHDALALADAHRPCLILVDFRMPGIDPERLITKLHERVSTLVVLCTGADVAKGVFQKSGADVLLRKPFTIDELLEIAKEAAKTYPAPVATP